MEFSNQLHLALYGESWDDKREREKTLTVTNLLKLETLSTEQIATVVNVSVEFVEKIKANIKKK